ncbi:MAG: hypothetical protein H7A19_08275 [Rhodanobacteraceae bacterium]|nr:hypothetical protein [Rhodanobacteraceae bacterium]
MGLLTLLDVLLGLFFVYMLFALIASAVNEAIASVLNSRAKWLRRGLSRLLQPSEMARILSSPRLMFIEGEFKSQEGKTFNPSYLRWSDLLHALCSRDGSPVDPPSMTSISDRIAEMPESPIKTILSELASEANMSMEAFERAFERWYEGFENSLRSWYRQKTQCQSGLAADAAGAVFGSGVPADDRHQLEQQHHRSALRQDLLRESDVLLQPDSAGGLQGAEAGTSG